MMYSIDSFTEDKFYLSTGKGENWSDYDGPFDNIQEVCDHMAVLCGEYTTPEMLHSAVVTHFKNNVLDLVKDDNGSPVNGNQIYWKNTIYYKGEVAWEPQRVERSG